MAKTGPQEGKALGADECALPLFPLFKPLCVLNWECGLACGTVQRCGRRFDVVASALTVAAATSTGASASASAAETRLTRVQHAVPARRRRWSRRSLRDNDDGGACLACGGPCATCESCANCKRDKRETDVDCGSTECAARCVNNKACKVPSDCAKPEGACLLLVPRDRRRVDGPRVCKHRTCNDEQQNGGEVR